MKGKNKSDGHDGGSIVVTTLFSESAKNGACGGPYKGMHMLCFGGFQSLKRYVGREMKGKAKGEYEKDQDDGETECEERKPTLPAFPRIYAFRKLATLFLK